jgi:hypothetical protein
MDRTSQLKADSPGAFLTFHLIGTYRDRKANGLAWRVECVGGFPQQSWEAISLLRYESRVCGSEQHKRDTDGEDDGCDQSLVVPSSVASLGACRKERN